MRRNENAGFSLVEILVSTAIFTIISAGVMTLVSNSHRSYANQRSRGDVVWQGRSAIDLMVRELRMAGYPPINSFDASGGMTPANSNKVATTFVTTTPTHVAFDADVDGDGIVDRVDYSLSGGTLQRSAVAKNSDGSVPAAQYQTLLENVVNGTAALFTYTTDPFSSLADPGKTNSVQILLLVRTATPDPKNGKYTTFAFNGLAMRQNPDH